MRSDEARGLCGNRVVQNVPRREPPSLGTKYERNEKRIQNCKGLSSWCPLPCNDLGQITSSTPRNSERFSDFHGERTI
jgi:hypothetical protein